MKEFLINISPNAITKGTVNSQLQSFNNYLVYATTIGGDLVSSMNVKDYLDNPINESITTSFFNFLKQNTTTQEFKEIFYNNQKLSNVFNDFYNKTVRFNEKPKDNIITEQNSNTSAFTYSNSNFLIDGNRSNKTIHTLISYNTGQSYYVPIFIKFNKNSIENSDFGQFKSDSFGPVETKTQTILTRYIQEPSGKEIDVLKKKQVPSNQVLIQKFVDYNFNDNESEFWSNEFLAIVSDKK